MAENKMEELVCKRKKFAGKNQTIIEGKVLIANSDLKKVEKIFCRAYVASCDAEKGVVKISGKANFVAIYETTDGEIKQTTFDTEFTSKVENDEINASDMCLANVSVVETDITSISSGDIKIAAVIDVYASVVCENAINYIKESDECACKKNTETVNYLTSVTTHNLKTTFDIETKENITEVLLASAMALPRRVSPSGDNTKLDGEMSVNLVYNNGEFPYIKTINECVQISEEIDHSISNENNVVEAQIEVKEISTSVQDGTVTFIVDLAVTLLEYTSAQIETVVDAFSTTNDINLTIENCTCEEALMPQMFDEKIAASAEVENDETQINKVTGASLKNFLVSSVHAGDEVLTVEGLATITVFTEVSEGENNSVSSVDVEVPFSIKNRFDGLTDDSLVDASVVLCDVYAKHKRLSEIEVYGVIKICATARNAQNVVVVTDLQVGELKTLNSNALSFVVTNKPYEMFELAKNLNVTEEQLLAQNPELKELVELSSVIPENTEIIVYRRRA